MAHILLSNVFYKGDDILWTSKIMTKHCGMLRMHHSLNQSDDHGCTSHPSATSPNYRVRTLATS